MVAEVPESQNFNYIHTACHKCDVVGDDMDDMVSSGSVVVEKENLWLGDSQVKLEKKEHHFIEI